MTNTRGRKLKAENSFIKEWRLKNNYSSLNQAALDRGIAQRTMCSLADIDTKHEIFAQILDIAEKMGMDPKTLMEGVLAGKNVTEVESTDIQSGKKSKKIAS